MKKGQGIVYLVGAGPGDPGLITVKGLDCVKKADVLIYDRLASPKLLTYARPEAELIYVGKSPDGHTLKQHEINNLLVAKAQQGLTVTRLKGGDPFVFGRGGEEAETLVTNGIVFEIVPGITSAIAVPAYAGIPVTHRDATSSFAIITGNEEPGKEDSNIAWDKIATGIGTLVFLMGIGNLSLICQKLIQHGRSAETPAAVINWGTRPEQRTLVGTLADIAQKVQQANFTNPGVIIVGEVVRYREQLSWFEKKPLFGKRILVTRSREQASVLSEQIEACGGEPWEFPTIKIMEPEDYSPLDAAIGKLSSYQWVIFTSANGVKYFFDRMRTLRKDIRDLAGPKICAIGPKTREALESYGLIVADVPEEYRAEQIVALLSGKLKAGDKVLLPRADIARKVLSESLVELGALVEEVVTYRTVLGAGNVDLLREMLQQKKIQIITFTSSSTVKNLVELLQPANLPDLLQGVTLASIGPVTSATARELGIEITVEAEEYTIDGLMKAILA
jgi:uroporphyrinogen III methyltransferase / synthase